MNNSILTTAITACHTALANVPFEAPDDEMDCAVQAVARAVDRVCRIPAFRVPEAEAKLSLASALLEWSELQERLVARANEELATLECNQRLRAA